MEPLKGQIVPVVTIYSLHHPHPINNTAGREKPLISYLCLYYSFQPADLVTAVLDHLSMGETDLD